MANIVVVPFEYFADPRQGRPLFNAQIYIGEVDQDPTVPANQIQAFYRQEDGTTVNLVQPIRTNSGGYPVNPSGDLIAILVNQPAYSMIVQDKSGIEVINTPGEVVSSAEPVNFVSVTAMIASTSLSENDIAITSRYNTDITQTWRINRLEVAGEFNVTLSNGLFATEISETKYFESFGAFADGTTLDDTAFEFARSYSGKTNGLGDYLISQQHDLSNNATWIGNWSKISMQGSNAFSVMSSNTEIRDFEIDGLDGDHTAWVLRIASPSSNVVIGDMEYRNFFGQASFQTYPLCIPAYGATDFNVGNQRFFNIRQVDNGVVAGPGFCGGIFLVGQDDDIANGKSNGVVGNVYGDTVKSVDGGQGLVQDSDLVRIFMETITTENFDIVFGNVTGRNVYKRLVKAGGMGGVVFGDCSSFNPEDPTDVYELFAVIEVLVTGRNFKFGNIYTDGPAERAVWFKGSGNSCGDVHDGSGSQAVIFGTVGEPAVSCQVGDIIGRGLNDSSQQGVGVSFLNADLCFVNSITGLFAVSVDTGPENTGHECNVESVLSRGRINAQFGNVCISCINTDITGTNVSGSHFIFGEGATIGSANIVTDGRVTMSIVGAGVNVDLGRTRLLRANASNGNAANHSVFTTASATTGLVRGKLEVIVGSTIDGTPSGSAGRTLAYFANINVEDLDLRVDVRASVRGATGFHYWFNNVDGQVNRASVKSLLANVGSQFNGSLGVTKIENLVPTPSNVTCTGEVNIFLAELAAGSNINGAANTPVEVPSTR